VHLLVITMLPSWWWTWRVEGLLVLHPLLLVMVVLTSIIRKLVLIHQWQSSLQGVNSINDSSNGVFHPLNICVSGLLVLHEYLGHRLNHGVNLFVANTFFFFVSHWWWWWWRLSLFWWHGEQKIESNTTGYRLVKIEHKIEGATTHSLRRLTPLL
jgi:hypothetical protein